MPGTVTSNLTRITAAEAADDASWEDISGGGGNVNSGEVFIQGAESQGRRVDNSEKGFSFDNTTGIDLSAADTLVGWWVNCLQPSQVGLTTNQDLEVRISSNTSPTSDWAGWDVLDAGNWPSGTALGGWIRIWVAINEATRDNDNTPTMTALRHFGLNSHIGDVAGNAPNLYCDAIDYLAGGGAALVLDAGTAPSPATFADLLSADEGTIGNKYGVWQSRSGILYCQIRTQIADATATVFDDSGFVIVFPLQQGIGSNNLVEADTNGLTIDLQNASTTVDWADGVLRSESSTDTQGDLLVTSASGSFSATGMRLEALRIVTLTSAVSITGSTFFECGLITAAGADLGGSTFQLGTGAVAVHWDVATNPGGAGGELDDTTFISDGTGHAIEFGATSPLVIDLNDITFTGYAGADGSTGDEAIWFRRSSGTITLNINGGTNPSVRTDGAIINKVINPVTLTVNVTDLSTGGNIENANVIVRPLNGTGPLPFEDSVSITWNGTDTATVTHTAHGLATNDLVEIRGATPNAYNGVHTITVTDANTYTYPLLGGWTAKATLISGVETQWGPYRSTGGDYYAFGLSGTTLTAYKSATAASGYSALGTTQSTGLGNDGAHDDIAGAWSFAEDEMHFVVLDDYAGGSSGQIADADGIRFIPSSDTWSTAVIEDGFEVDISANFGIDVAYDESQGSVYFAMTGPMEDVSSTLYRRTYAARWNGSSWDWFAASDTGTTDVEAPQGSYSGSSRAYVMSGTSSANSLYAVNNGARSGSSETTQQEHLHEGPGAAFDGATFNADAESPGGIWQRTEGDPAGAPSEKTPSGWGSTEFPTGWTIQVWDGELFAVAYNATDDDVSYSTLASAAGSWTAAVDIDTSEATFDNARLLPVDTDDDGTNDELWLIYYDGTDTVYRELTAGVATPATGSPEATAVIIKGLTNASGIISDTRSYGSNQPIAGWARKSSGSPYYRTGSIAGTIDNGAGLSLTVQLASDE